MYVVTVLAVVDDRYAVAAVREIGVLLRADLKAREVPERIFVDGALNMAKLNII